MLAGPVVIMLPMELVEVHASNESFVTLSTSCALVAKLKTAHSKSTHQLKKIRVNNKYFFFLNLFDSISS